MTDKLDHCHALVRTADRDRYLSALFAPSPAREGLLALYSFNAEIARVREVVSDPLPGEIRLQWWRDALSRNDHGDVDQHPIAAAIRATITSFRLPLAAFDNLIEARVFDLYDDPMPSLSELEGYCGDTSSALIQLSAIILAKGDNPGTADVAGHAGVAYALVGLMRALPWHAARRQLYLPQDLLERHNVDPETIFSGRTTPQLRAALAELQEHARHHLAKTRTLIEAVPRHCIPAFLPICLVEPYLDALAKPDRDPLRQHCDLSLLRRHWILWRSWKKACIACSLS